MASMWSGVPLQQLTADETEQLVGLEGALHGRVVGQNEAVSAISRAVRRARVGLKDPKRPIAALMFCGPTGVGKTELAKSLAQSYFGTVRPSSPPLPFLLLPSPLPVLSFLFLLSSPLAFPPLLPSLGPQSCCCQVGSSIRSPIVKATGQCPFGSYRLAWCWSWLVAVLCHDRRMP